MQTVFFYIKNPLKTLAAVFRRTGTWLPDKTYLQILYYLRMGKVLHLNNPKTFTEKLQWLKLYDRKPEYTMMVDKLAVKNYVSKIIGEKYVVPTLGVWDRPEDIDWDSLPDKFVLKTKHGSGSVGVVICREKCTFNFREAIGKLKKSLKQDVYVDLREWPYKNVKKQIIAEMLLEDSETKKKDIIDYKFFCFKGEPKYCQVIKDRHTKETIDFFDMQWRHLDFIGLNPVAEPSAICSAICPTRPVCYEEMKQIAQKLSKGFPFVRVDLYEVNKKVYFSEITLYPKSGMGIFNPEKYNYILGEMITLPR